MSSAEFSVQLTADRRLRSLVMLSAAVSAGLGFLLILHLPQPLVLRALSLIAWLFGCGYQALTYANNAARVRRIRLNNFGDVHIEDWRGRQSGAGLLPGSVVLENFAWLRMRLDDGQEYGEFLARIAIRESEWHRLQLVWQQCRQKFNGAEGR